MIAGLVFCNISKLNAQIKLGNNPKSLNPNAVLEIESSNKGLLLPRLALSSTTVATPLSDFVQGMFVYNTAFINDVTPGIYYCDGSKWIKVNSSNSSTGSWNINGNSSTSSINGFLGTTDNAPLLFKTNNTERMRITEKGWIGIGTSSPSAALEIKGQLIIDSLTKGDLATDNVLVSNSSDGKIKVVSSASFLMGMEKRTEIVTATGQAIFNTPFVITDINKILLYRNGVSISFTINNANSILSEIPCAAGDEIKIFQLK